METIGAFEAKAYVSRVGKWSNVPTKPIISG